METFVVRIYRHSETSTGDLAGTVEHVGSGERLGFAGREQLLDRLLTVAQRGDANVTPAADRACGQRNSP
jgi:hypothetical protein